MHNLTMKNFASNMINFNLDCWVTTVKVGCVVKKSDFKYLKLSDFEGPERRKVRSISIKNNIYSVLTIILETHYFFV